VRHRYPGFSFRSLLVRLEEGGAIRSPGLYWRVKWPENSYPRRWAASRSVGPLVLRIAEIESLNVERLALFCFHSNVFSLRSVQLVLSGSCAWLIQSSLSWLRTVSQGEAPTRLDSSSHNLATRQQGGYLVFTGRQPPREAEAHTNSLERLDRSYLSTVQAACLGISSLVPPICQKSDSAFCRLFLRGHNSAP
jgi:hypothetical protein